jgi:hypothetical protein
MAEQQQQQQQQHDAVAIETSTVNFEDLTQIVLDLETKHGVLSAKNPGSWSGKEVIFSFIQVNAI